LACSARATAAATERLERPERPKRPGRTTSLTAFRVVQEALSNVLQHSPGAPLELSVTGDGAGTVLRIVAENPTTTSPRTGGRIGLGLLGMTERVRAAGGSVEIGATAQNTWRIDAALPLRRASALS